MTLYFMTTPSARRLTMFMTLISGLMAGPAVSLSGSPTVSPVTAALCASEPLHRNCRLRSTSWRCPTRRRRWP